MLCLYFAKENIFPLSGNEGFCNFCFSERGAVLKSGKLSGVLEIKPPVTPSRCLGVSAKTNLKPPLPKGGGSRTASDGGIHHFQK